MRGSVSPLALVTSRTVLPPAIGGGGGLLSTTPATIQISYACILRACLPTPLSTRSALLCCPGEAHDLLQLARGRVSSLICQVAKEEGRRTSRPRHDVADEGCGDSSPSLTASVRLPHSPTSRVSTTYRPTDQPCYPGEGRSLISGELLPLRSWGDSPAHRF